MAKHLDTRELSNTIQRLGFVRGHADVVLDLATTPADGETTEILGRVRAAIASARLAYETLLKLEDQLVDAAMRPEAKP